MLICVNGINLHKSINCLFALPLCRCMCVCWCVCALPPWPNLAIGTLRAGEGATPSRKFANWPKKEKQRDALSKLKSHRPLSPSLSPTLPAPHHIWETWRGLEKKWNDFFSLVCPPLFPLWGLLSLSAPWRLNVIFYSYLFIKARKAARTDWIVTDLTAGSATPPLRPTHTHS